MTSLVGLVALGIGLLLLQGSHLGFTAQGAMNGVVSQLGTTLPAAVSVVLATAIEVVAGAALVRLIRWAPYGSLAEAAVWGLVGAVVKDTVLLLTLGSVGHFGPLPLALIDLALITGGFFLRPFVHLSEHGSGPRRWSPVAWSLPLVIWSIPLVLQLASPVVPFLDVLPNHVAPVEHLRTFASWESLAVSPSPIYGPSRIFLGYVALVGSVATLAGLPATLAVAAFALPLSVLLAAGGYHLCRLLAGPAAGYWSLMTVPLTFTFLRLPDARATVLAFPLAAAAIALTLPEARDRARPLSLAGRSRPMLLAAALGSTVLVHPVIGGLAVVMVALIAVIGGGPLRRPLLAGVVGSALMALPQAALMVGLAAPPAWTAVPALPAGLLLAGWLAGPGPRRGGVTETLFPSSALGALGSLGAWRIALGSTLLLVALGGGAVLLLQRRPTLPMDVATSIGHTLADYTVILLALAIGVVLARDARSWLVLGTGITVGLTASGMAQLAPIDTRLGESIYFEIPKSVGYWAPWLVALAGGIGLGALWIRDAWPGVVRVGLASVVVAAAALPLRARPMDILGIEEHRYAESAAIVLGEAEVGYWLGHPDSRTLVAAPGAALAGQVRSEQAAGRLPPHAQLLHIAPSFQQWVATPLGVLTGVIETTATEDPEDSVHTLGGRLRGLEELDALLASGVFSYVVIEGYEREAGYLDAAQAHGYVLIGIGEGWQLLRRE